MRNASQHTKRVSVVHADATAHAAARVMHHDAVGCVVVVDERERPVGILTDRDLAVRAVAVSNAPHELRVADLMTPDPVAVTPETSMRDALLLMRRRGVRRLPVVRDGRAVGMVSLDDVLEELSRDLRDLAAEAPNRYRTAPSSSRFEHVRAGLERGLEELRGKLEYAQWYARETLIDELDELRSRLRKSSDA